MNKKKVTKHKVSKSKKNNDQAEVFVLPPNLLEELGINLGSIEVTEESTTEHKESDKDFLPIKRSVGQYNHISNNTENCLTTTSETESSIIQTATLMKESVFLSPTFISNNTNTIQGEFEVVGNNYTDKAIPKINEFNVGNGEVTEEASFVLPESISIFDFQNSSSAEASMSTQDAMKDHRSTDFQAMEHNNTKEALYDEHADEAYSSDCSNSNIDKADVLHSPNLHLCSEIKQNVNKKINIISEQILDPSQLKLKKCHSPKGNNLNPVTVNSVINSQYKNSISYENNMHTYVCPDLITACVKPEICEVKITNLPTEVDKTPFNAIVNIKETIPEIIDNSDSNNILLNEKILHDIQKQDDLRHANESLGLSTHAMQQNDDSTILPCAIDNDETGNSNKPDVLIESCNKSTATTATKFVFEEEKVNDSLETVNAISFHEQNYHEDSKSMKHSSPDSVQEVSDNFEISSSTQYHIEERTQKCREDMSTEDGNGTVNDIANNSSNFNENHSESDLNVECQDLKLENKKTTKRSSDIMYKESIINTKTKIQVLQGTEEYDKQRSKYQKGGEKNRSKMDRSGYDTCQGSNLDRPVKSDCEKNAADVEMDKVREIAKYLSQFAQIQKRKISNMTYDCNSTKTSPNKKQSASSKLSIQGVEKPGGSLKKRVCKKNNNVRTYARKNKCASTVKMISDTYKNYNIPARNIDLPDKNKPDTCNENKICLCGDFGRLISYDIQNIHENICFCSKNKNICTPDIIFSIYNEEFSAKFIDDAHKDCSVEEYITYAFNEIMSCDDNGTVSPVKGSENILEMWPETSVCYVNQTSVNDLENCDKTTNNRFDPEPGEIPSTRQKRKCSPKHDRCEAASKKRRILQFPSKYDEITRNEIATMEEYTVEDFRNINQCANSSDQVSKVESGIHDKVINVATPVNSDFIKCGVCEQSMQSKDWIHHIELEHNYLAWKHGERALNFNKENAVREHLSDLIKEFGGLKCAKCGRIRKYVKSYLAHIQRCDGPNESLNASAFKTSSITISQGSVRNTGTSISNNSVKNEAAPVNNEVIKCGVCNESMHCRDWQSHLKSLHHYLAWKSGDPAIDVNDDEAVREHLYNLAKEFGGLECAKCGVVRKHVKSYITHIKDCNGLNESHNANAFDSSSDIVPQAVRNTRTSMVNDSIKKEAGPLNSEVIKCGVCDESMHCRDWQSHIESQHLYLAWKCGEPALDVNDEEAVREHLYDFSKEFGGLKCTKCGVIRKYVKSYLTHIQSCNGPSEFQNDSAFNDNKVDSSLVSDVSGINQAGAASDETVKCGVCGESVQCTDWRSHVESRHDYLAWKYGEPILDVNDKEAVHEHLYDITKKYGGLKCSKCGLIRKYVKSYLTHIQDCNGLDESQDDSELNASLGVFEEESACRVSNSTTNVGAVNETALENHDLIRCGVCGQSTQSKDWICHIRTQHNYLAWKLGQPALDVDDEESVREHLYGITKECGGLECSKCGVTRRYVKSYLSHFNSCGEKNGEERSLDPVKSSKYEVLLDFDSSLSKLGDDLVKCGICGQYMVPKDWMAHIADKHNYLAWKTGDPPLDVKDEVEVRHHLQKLIDEMGPLTCSKCGLRRKYVKTYLQHIHTCRGSENSLNDSALNDDMDEVITPTSGPDQIQCGVCREILESSLWISHIAEQHEYLAWKEGETPLDLNDKDKVSQNLKCIIKKCGALTCKSCGKTIKLVKTYLQHIETCNQDVDLSLLSVDAVNSSLDLNESCVDFNSGGTCGVCRQAVASGSWIQHTQRHHNYLAWRDGDKPWDLDDFTEVNEHLYVISKKMNGLICNKCGLVRKYVKSYLTHIKNCTSTDSSLEFSLPDDVGPWSDQALYQCAMCKEKIEPAQWKHHAMREHYNITWIVGQTPIDIKNPYAVERYLKEYREKRGLKCKCGASRASYAGFYAHIITCGKTEEQIEMFKNICEICNNSYLCIYKNQHMAIHRVQEYNKELKLKKLEAKQEEKVEEIPSGKRRAAQKARSVIENYSNDLDRHTFKCESCGFGTEFRDELKSHKCEISTEVDFSSEESSSAEDEPSGDDSADSSLYCDVSAEEEESRKKRYKPSEVTSKVPRLPFQVANRTAYLLQADEDFCNAYFTDDTLFPQWHSCEHEMVSKSDLSRYLPPIEQSCKVKYSSGWATLKRFESLNCDGISIFVGSCIASISWVPLRVDDIFSGTDNFLAVACHNDVDEPRYLCEETPSHENLIQIWEFNTHPKLPKIIFGIAHDFGTVWSMDWCPSGARDLLPEDFKDGHACRLGLLAVACSNGSAYIFSVPYPSTVVKNDTFIYKAKPVAELRMTMNSNRRLYQATSITWSKEKGHKIVLVGYADGSTANYDLSCDSPLLRVVDNNVEVFFPYDDERPHNSCITATDMYPSVQSGAGATVAAGLTGTVLGAARRGAGGARARFPAAGRAAAFAPHWPAAMLAGDIAVMSTVVTEVEWGAAGRRLGGASALAGCARCGVVAAATPPSLRLMRTHPVYPELKKQVFGMLELIRLDNKRKKQVNDELAMQLEPLTYADTVRTYGIEFRTVREINKAKQRECTSIPRAQYPERFPLADVKSMAFCPSWKYHNRLAVATHSGIIFIMNVAS